MRRSLSKHGAEERIRALASRQHGIITRAQLLSAGVTPDTVDRKLERSWLRPLHRGVYAMDVVAAPLAKEMAAVLACGGDAVISHRSAGALWELLPGPGERAPVEVITPSVKRPRRPGIHAHRLELAPGEITLLRRLPITTPARTLLDVSAVAGRRELENALARALRRGLTDRSHLRVLLDRHPRRRGTRKLSVLLQPGETAAFTRSKAEERFLELIQRAQLPAPELNVSVCGHEVDFYWRAVRLVVEIDGFAFHSSAEMFESDRRRDAVLIAAGVRVIRATWHQLEAEREALVARLAQALARSAKE